MCLTRKKKTKNGGCVFVSGGVGEGDEQAGTLGWDWPVSASLLSQKFNKPLCEIIYLCR